MTALAIIFTGHNTKNLTIYECPEISGCDTIRITISEDNSGCIEHMTGVFTDLRLKRALTDELTHDIIQFTNGNMVGIERIRRLLGFMPTYKIVDNHRKYINPSEFAALKKPIVYTDVFGVQIPKAFARCMNILIIPDFPDFGENTVTKYSLVKGHILNIGQDYNDGMIETALNKLNVPDSVFTPSDMAVFSGLQFLHLFSSKPMIISGDGLRPLTLDNCMIAGETNPAVYTFAVYPSEEYLKFGYDFWARTNEYKEIEEIIANIRKKSPMHKRALKAFLDGE
jgi:hypothetical protein